MMDYAVVTPAHDELDNLRRLGEAMVRQLRRPAIWVIVDDGSTDGTRELAAALSGEHAWIEAISVSHAGRMARGAPVVRSFAAGLESIESLPSVVVKLDADVSFEEDYFDRLIGAFEREPTLGMASGSAFEVKAGIWRQQFGTGTSVWGASRAYRREALPSVLPLSERMGWDAIDEHKAQIAGWSTRTLVDLPFRHHRPEGERDFSRGAAWRAQGDVAHYLGYRPSYLVARAAYNALRDPSAVAMLGEYLARSLRRAERCPDAAVVDRVRAQQRLRLIWRRAREKAGRIPGDG